MNLQPYSVARYGIYAALVVAAISVWLGQQAGATLDFTMMRAVFVFVVFTAIGFGAEVVLTVGVHPTSHEPSTAEPYEAPTDE
jgi:Na+/glutamate symporter